MWLRSHLFIEALAFTSWSSDTGERRIVWMTYTLIQIPLVTKPHTHALFHLQNMSQYRNQRHSQVQFPLCVVKKHASLSVFLPLSKLSSASTAGVKIFWTSLHLTIDVHGCVLPRSRLVISVIIYSTTVFQHKFKALVLFKPLHERLPL